MALMNRGCIYFCMKIYFKNSCTREISDAFTLASLNVNALMKEALHHHLKKLMVKASHTLIGING